MAVTRCVLVDDDPEFISFARVCLWRLCPELEIVTFSSAVEALRFLVGHPTDLLITDFKMPYVNGLELTQEVRANECELDIPIVVTSGADIEAEALAKGANIFVRKCDLLARLGSILERFNLIHLATGYRGSGHPEQSP
jgi:CheY-like chemotaxis protein